MHDRPDWFHINGDRMQFVPAESAAGTVVLRDRSVSATVVTIRWIERRRRSRYSRFSMQWSLAHSASYRTSGYMKVWSEDLREMFTLDSPKSHVFHTYPHQRIGRYLSFPKGNRGHGDPNMCVFLHDGVIEAVKDLIEHAVQNQPS